MSNLGGPVNQYLLTSIEPYKLTLLHFRIKRKCNGMYMLTMVKWVWQRFTHTNKQPLSYQVQDGDAGTVYIRKDLILQFLMSTTIQLSVSIMCFMSIKAKNRDGRLYFVHLIKIKINGVFFVQSHVHLDTPFYQILHTVSVLSIR